MAVDQLQQTVRTRPTAVFWLVVLAAPVLECLALLVIIVVEQSFSSDAVDINTAAVTSAVFQFSFALLFAGMLTVLAAELISGRIKEKGWVSRAYGFGAFLIGIVPIIVIAVIAREDTRSLSETIWIVLKLFFLPTIFAAFVLRSLVGKLRWIGSPEPPA